MERIFPHFKAQKVEGSASYDPSDPASYKAMLQAMFSDGVDYEESWLAGNRSALQQLYYGLSPSLDYTDVAGPYRGEDPNATIGEILNKDDADTPNRSSYVSTDVRDAIMLVMPALIRLFAATEAPVYLVPRSEQDSDMAQQATDFVNYTFWNENPGFLILYGAFKDALTVKTGFAKWWTETNKEVKFKTFRSISEDQIKLMTSEDPTAKVFELGKPIADNVVPFAKPLLAPPPQPAPAPPMGAGPQGAMAGGQMPGLPAGPPQPPPTTYDKVVIRYEDSKPKVKVSAVPPEEMRLDRYARTFRDSRFVGHERVVPVDQLVAMGIDRDLCLENIQSSDANTFSVEPQLRNPARFMGSQVSDGCLFGEWYVKIDKDGDDIPELRFIRTIGGQREIVDDEYANRIKFCLFSVDPVAHTIVGDSLADFIEDIQIIKTRMMRAILDSAAESINPKTVINENMVNVDDALNDDLGAVIRTRGDVNATVAFTSTPFLGQQAMPLVEMINDQLARRTGLTDAAKGLDPKALQSSTEIGVEAVINGQQERVEMTARVLAETGFKDLFAGIYNEICENPNQRMTLKLRGKWTEYDTSTFDESMSIEVNENLGKGSDMTRMVALQGIKQDQQLIVSQMGLNNPICGIQEMLNTQTDMLALANVKNVGRYFKTPTPEQFQQLASQPAKPDPMAVAAQAQLEKVRSESAQALVQQQFNAHKLQTDTDLKRDQLHQKTALDLQKLSLDADKAGIDHHVAIAQLGSQLQKDQSDREQADQDTQLKQAQVQNEQDAGQIQARQAESDMAIKQAQMLAQHKQATDGQQAQHTQAMTKMAADHHATMTGHAVKGATAVVGAMAGDADRAAGAQQGDADRQHASKESQRDREHQATTTAATLKTQTNIAKMKPKPKPAGKKK